MADIELINSLKANADRVRESISDYCKEAGRSTDSVTLIGVSKVFPVEYAEAAVRGGLLDLGENKVQELVPKSERLNELGLNPNWHLIGTLQKNKVKYIIGKTHLIHSVDSVELAREIAKRSANNSVRSDILLQVNVAKEESKHGFEAEEMKSVVSELQALDGIRLRGLMTMAPIQSYDGEARKTFSETRELFDSLKNEISDTANWDVISMGMSQDYKYAILEGSTHIRIGTSIFGDRSKLL